jgi:hypothetical protein
MAVQGCGSGDERHLTDGGAVFEPDRPESVSYLMDTGSLFYYRKQVNIGQARDVFFLDNAAIEI